VNLQLACGVHSVPIPMPNRFSGSIVLDLLDDQRPYNVLCGYHNSSDLHDKGVRGSLLLYCEAADYSPFDMHVEDASHGLGSFPQFQSFLLAGFLWS